MKKKRKLVNFLKYSLNIQNDITKKTLNPIVFNYQFL
jgi:hypothetical protein